MSSRRSLVEGLNPADDTDPADAKRFVFGSESAPIQPKAAGGTAKQPNPAPVATASLVPLTTRLRPELAAALKRASLERQLAGIQPNTVQDILEEALQPWLQANGYLS